MAQRHQLQRAARRSVAGWGQDDRAAQQQEHLLDEDEKERLSRQVQIYGVGSSQTEAQVSAFFALFGSVQRVCLTFRQTRNGHRSGSALIEFNNKGDADRMWRQTRLVDTTPVTSRQGLQRLERWLIADSIGHLRQRGGRVSHVRCQRVMPRRGRLHRDGQSDNPSWTAVSLQIGSLGHDGTTLVYELDVQKSCHVTVNLQQRCLDIAVPGPLFSSTEATSASSLQDMFGSMLVFHLCLPFRHLRRGMQLEERAGSPGSLSFTARQPVKILEEQQDIFSISGDDKVKLVCNGASTITGQGLPQEMLDEATYIGSHLLGHSLSYRMILDTTSVAGLANPRSAIGKKLRDFKLLRVAGRNRAVGGVRAVKSRQQWEAVNGQCNLRQWISSLPFEVGYRVLVLLTSGAATKWQVSHPEFVYPLHLARPGAACAALAALATSHARLPNAASALQDALREGPAAGAGYTEEVLRVHVTPSRLLFLRPEQEMGNRVVRHFSDEPDAASGARAGDPAALRGLRITKSHFMRVSFGDEGRDRLYGHGDEDIEGFYERIKKLMLEGISVNGRHFVFLAYASSQLKAWSCWFVANPRMGQNGAQGATALADELRMWMGDALTTIRVPAKCAARLGQCFSATVQTVQIQRHEEVPISDVERNGFCFSDGVGRISPLLMREMLAKVPFVSSYNNISAVQVRIGGSKGVLSVLPELSGQQINLRPSMTKFMSPHARLEVCTVAAWIPAYLNRPIILMLDYHGVTPETLLCKLEVNLNSLACMCESPSAALSMLPNIGGVECGSHSCMLHMLTVAVKLGLPFDPLMASSLRAVAKWQVTDLRQKARLLVAEGVTLMGVLDEYGILEEGQIFLQTTKLLDPSVPAVRRTITGTVVIAKNPVAHRGDVRLVEAVDDARLRDAYVNVVVFSQKGSRPLPNMLSGSDLDGDLFQVIWDPDLVWPSRRNADPMQYTASTSPPAVSSVTVPHIVDHFVNHIKNDNLGQISTWLIAHADKKGVDCPECEQLAMAHSTAVDFAKTGVPAEYASIKDLNPDEFPHWMERGGDSYLSTKILGRMYDRVLQHPVSNMLQESQWSDQGRAAAPGTASCQAVAAGLGRLVAWGQSLTGWAACMEEAEEAAKLMEHEVLALMNRWHVDNVGELVTCCLSRLQRSNQKRQMSEQKDQLRRELNSMFGRSRHAFLSSLLRRQGQAPPHPEEARAAGYQTGGAPTADAELLLRDLEQLVDESMPLSSTTDTATAAVVALPRTLPRLQLACAYLSVSIRDLSGPPSAHHAATEREEDDDGDGPDSDEDDSEGALQVQVQLCVQWVVARELHQCGVLASKDAATHLAPSSH